MIDTALEDPTRRVLLTTYTLENLEQIRRRIIESCGSVPPHIQLMSWFSFLLRECIKPYQSFVTDVGRIKSLNFVSDPRLGARRARVNEYYIDHHNDVYARNASDLACTINSESGGLVVNRLADIFDLIIVDEAQDLAGYDLELVEVLFRSPISVLLVGDPRQTTYSTNRSTKNSAYRGLGLFRWFEEHELAGVCTVERRLISYRCDQTICDFADSLYPDLPPTTSHGAADNAHVGVHTISAADVAAYIAAHDPQILRYQKTSNTMGYPAQNFGVVKGLTFDHVLIFPTSPMKKFLRTRNPRDGGDLARFYVAVTRARFSVAFVV
ncbi:TGBp1 family protein [Cellulosimicrobium cellulans]|uniref:TGBp1 family protein n=1 Tax=Cellulosimicrobium cellulans TaxID=1710 RepID=UPI002149F87B|nr:TGBp1 family protein [Cellulosimicrobium cellulans]